MGNAPRIRLTYVISDMIRGGAQTLLWETVRHLDPCTYDVCVVSLTGSPEYPIPEHVRAISLCSDSFHIFKTPAPYRRLWHELTTHSCDILHTHLYMGDVVGQAVGWARGVPLIYTTLHSSVEWDRSHKTIRTRVEDAMLSIPDRIFTVSESLRRQAIDERGAPPDKTVTLHNGLDFAPYGLGSEMRARTRTGLGLSEEDIVILCIAQFRRVKRHDRVIEAFALLKARVQHVRLLLVGSNGPDREEILRHAGNLGVGDSVIVRPAMHDELPAYCAASDLFTMHSDSEGGPPLAMLEAMASGLPVVVPDLPVFAEGMRPNIDGYAFRHGDTEDHAVALAKLAVDLRMGRKFWQGAAARIRNEFSISQHVGRLLGFYEADLAVCGRIARFRREQLHRATRDRIKVNVGPFRDPWGRTGL